jgi:hypothetical protein
MPYQSCTRTALVSNMYMGRLTPQPVTTKQVSHIAVEQINETVAAFLDIKSSST